MNKDQVRLIFPGEIRGNLRLELTVILETIKSRIRGELLLKTADNFIDGQVGNGINGVDLEQF